MEEIAEGETLPDFCEDDPEELVWDQLVTCGFEEAKTDKQIAEEQSIYPVNWPFNPKQIKYGGSIVYLLGKPLEIVQVIP